VLNESFNKKLSSDALAPELRERFSFITKLQVAALQNLIWLSTSGTQGQLLFSGTAAAAGGRAVAAAAFEVQRADDT
jgi:hypothetical protein